MEPRFLRHLDEYKIEGPIFDLILRTRKEVADLRELYSGKTLRELRKSAVFLTIWKSGKR